MYYRVYNKKTQQTERQSDLALVLGIVQAVIASIKMARGNTYENKQYHITQVN